MKILVVGDKHLSINRFELSLKYLAWLESIISTNNYDAVVYLGDDMNTHAILRSELLEEYRNHIYKITGTCLVYYVVGNHDCYKPNSMKYHAFQTLKDIPGFYVIDKVTSYRGMTFVPYLYDHTQFPTQTDRICFAHQTFLGADFGYIRPEVGVMAETVSADIIISGHVHKRQTVGKVIYPGSAYAVDMRDIDEFKGVMEFDTETYKYSFIEAPFSLWKNIHVTLGTGDETSKAINTIRDLLNTEDHWVINITGWKAEVGAFFASKEVKAALKDVKFKVNPTFLDKEKKLIQIKSSKFSDIIVEYIDRIYNGNISRDLLKKRALSVLKDVGVNNGR